MTQPSPNTNQLFKILATGQFGTFLTEDGDNKYVLSMSDGGYEAFTPEELERVCPYTIQIDFMAGGGAHFKVPKDHGLEEGDSVIIGRNFGIVKKLDTRRDNAQTAENLRLIVTQPISTQSPQVVA
ncbi:hypothetical protein MHM88_14590 [Epibacterium sp. MM17-32]|uniref:hypothetical protein n=1 Tax=Epibacterium sp. MM17-32 TaxID=2917734 RepID=UPI001EF41428|nr:hypothetical protein [Epibacterium sp. MM17-32]MCG7629036.1 hypothetical protein [Epibacterium sp. MM17-32]